MSTPGSSPGVSAQPRTPDGQGGDSGGIGRDELRAERETLAAVIAHPKMPADVRRYEPDACDRCPKMLDAADAVLAAGFRRLTADAAKAYDEAALRGVDYLTRGDRVSQTGSRPTLPASQPAAEGETLAD